jgi:predicted Holliday junction resolvase-like endonuclease
MLVALIIVGVVALATLAASVLIARELRAAAASNTEALEGAWRAAHAERQDAMDRLMETVGVHYDSKLRIEEMRSTQAEALATEQAALYRSEEEQDRAYIERRSAEALFDADSNAEIGELYSALGINPDGGVSEA